MKHKFQPVEELETKDTSLTSERGKKLQVMHVGSL